MITDYTAMLERLAEVSANIQANTTEMHRVRHWKQRVFRAAVTAAVIAVIALGGMAYAIWQNHEAVAAVHVNQIQGCHIANMIRLREVQLWEHVVAVSRPPAGETPADRKQRQQTTRLFLGYVHRTFRELDCQRLYGA